MAPTRTSRAATKEKENGTVAEVAGTETAAPAKRGRGRPPKNGIAAQEKRVPTGRPRGRPAGTSTGVKKATTKATTRSANASGPGRRGRPRKSDASAPATTPKKAALKSKPASTGKGRGRPRRSDPAVFDEPEGEEDEEDEADDKADDDEGKLRPYIHRHEAKLR